MAIKKLVVMATITCRTKTKHPKLIAAETNKKKIERDGINPRSSYAWG